MGEPVVPARRFTPDEIFGGRIYGWRIGKKQSLLFKTDMEGRLTELALRRSSGRTRRFPGDGSVIEYPPGSTKPEVLEAPLGESGFNCESLSQSVNSAVRTCVLAACRYANCAYFGICVGGTQTDLANLADAACLGSEVIRVCPVGQACCVNCGE